MCQTLLSRQKWRWMHTELIILYLIWLFQDDFLPRTPTPLEDIFRSIFWLVSLSPFGGCRKPLSSFTVLIYCHRSELLLLSLIPGLDPLDSLPCLMFLICLRDTFIPEGRKLRDPRRLYAPGRMYHIVERKFCR